MDKIQINLKNKDSSVIGYTSWEQFIKLLKQSGHLKWNEEIVKIVADEYGVCYNINIER